MITREHIEKLFLYLCAIYPYPYSSMSEEQQEIWKSVWQNEFINYEPEHLEKAIKACKFTYAPNLPQFGELLEKIIGIPNVDKTYELVHEANPNNPFIRLCKNKLNKFYPGFDKYNPMRQPYNEKDVMKKLNSIRSEVLDIYREAPGQSLDLFEQKTLQISSEPRTVPHDRSETTQ